MASKHQVLDLWEAETLRPVSSMESSALSESTRLNRISKRRRGKRKVRLGRARDRYDQEEKKSIQSQYMLLIKSDDRRLFMQAHQDKGQARKVGNSICSFL